MKLLHLTIALMFMLLPLSSIAQNDSVYIKPDKMPEYVGGENAKNKFIQKNLQYPKNPRHKHINGKVVADVIVEKDGSLSNIRILRSLDPDFDKEVKRVISMMPKWKPAYHQNQPVRARINIPIVFILTDYN